MRGQEDAQITPLRSEPPPAGAWDASQCKLLRDMRRAFTVTAIIATYNEEDVIGAVLKDLMDQGVRVHLLDQGSSDATLAEAERVNKRGLLHVERFEGEDFSLARIIKRKEVLAAELETDWVVNADADEFRESPWPGLGFADGVQEVDRLGFNAIDFAVLNFLPVDDSFRKGDDPREVFRFYAPGAMFDRLQVRCWKKQPGHLDLVSTGGHEAQFPGRRVFPVRFLLRHYPIRGQAHGARKVFKERRARFSAEERARGWHVQYDGLEEGVSFLREPSSLTPYDPGVARLDLALRHRGVEALEQELAAARAQLAVSREESARRGDELAATRQELGGVRGELAGTRDALVSARDLVSMLDREMSAARAAAEAVRLNAESIQAERDSWRRAHEVAQSQIRERDRAAEHLRADLESLRGESERVAERLRKDVEWLQDELRKRSGEVSLMRLESEAAERRRAALQYRLDAVLASRIWRWTTSLRGLLDRVSRG